MIKIGLFGIGLDTYWNQFDGLLENLKNHQKQIKTQIESFGVEVVDVGIIDNPESARKAGYLLKTNDVEIVFMNVSTYELLNLFIIYKTIKSKIL